jgi:hypothetical protein
MKTTFKARLFIFFIPLILLACSLCSWAEEEASTQIKDIQILVDNDKKAIKVSIEEIKERLLKGGTNNGGRSLGSLFLLLLVNLGYEKTEI